MESMTQRILLDGVKDHLIPHLVEKNKSKEMWHALKKLYENKDKIRKMALRDKLLSTRMDKGESVASYLTWMRQVKDELRVVGEIVTDSEFVHIALKGFTKQWDVFMKRMVGKEKFPS
jgi:2-phosphoglycerate kinase